MWFESLTGFCEESAKQVRDNLTVDAGVLTSRVNGKAYVCGCLETPSLAELRERVQCLTEEADGILGRKVEGDGMITLRELVADVQSLHVDPANAGALFQVASQFNLLEMVSPEVTPEQGVGRYEYDHTQGPACAIACGAGTIYRNYFAPVPRSSGQDPQVGQTETCQIDCLADLGDALGNSEGRLWEMKNGYALATLDGLAEINQRVQSASEPEVDALRGLLRAGVQWDTGVTLGESSHMVTQIYGSALPVAYSQYSSDAWESLARLVLEASYEATLCAGLLNAQKTGNRKVYLTLLGGGAFGNKLTWIIYAIERAVKRYEHTALDVIIVSYGSSCPEVRSLIERVNDLGSGR